MLNWATRNRLLPLPFDVSRRTRNYADGRGHRQSTPLLDICSLFPAPFRGAGAVLPPPAGMRKPPFSAQI